MKRVTFLIIFFLLSAVPAAFSQSSNNVSLIGRWAGGPSYTVASQGSTIYYGDGAYLRILKKKSTGGYIKGKITLPSIVEDVAVSGHYAYVADDKAGLRVVDVSSPQHPVEVGSYSSTYPYIATGITVIGHDVYLANFYNSNTIATAITIIIDISNPSKPVYVKKENFYGKNSVVSGNIMAVVSGAGGSPQEVDFVDISDPGNPKSLGYFMPVFYDASGVANGIAIKGHTAYIAYGSGTILQGQGKTVGLWVVDITNPLSPKQITSYPTASNAMNVAVVGNYAFVGTENDGLRIIDISDSTQPKEVGAYFSSPNKDNNYHYPQKFISVNDTGYVAYATNGLRLIDYSNPASVITIDSFPTAASGNSLTIKGNYAYISDDGDGMQIINIKDPSNPVRAGFFSPSATLPNRSFDVAIHNNYAYLASSNAGKGSPGGLKMIDISDRTHPTQIGSYRAGNTFSVNRVFTKGNYTFFIQSEAYIDNKNGLVVLNTSDPSNPVKVGSIHNDWVGDLIHKGNYAYLFADSIYVIDIADPNNIKIVGSLAGGASSGYSGNTAIYGSYLYILYASGELVTKDISDPSNPKEFGDIYLNTMNQGWNTPVSVAVDNQFVYVSSDTTLMIFNKSNLSASSKAVGYYSTGDYATAIKVHEDTIFVTDNNDGLYILHNDLYATPGLPPVVNLPDTIKITAGESYSYKLTDIAGIPDSLMPVYDVDTPDSLLAFKIWYVPVDSNLTLRYDTQTYSIIMEADRYADYTGYVEVSDNYGATTTDSTVIAVRNTTGVNDIVSKIPKTYYLSQNYPNPFHSGTEISFGMPVSGVATLKIYDLSGHEVAILINEFKKAGTHKIKFDASKLAKGVYFYQLSIKSGARNFVEIKKMILKK